MLRSFTCIMCPRGCEIKTEYEKSAGQVTIVKIEGNSCPKGKDYVTQELISPMRSIASSILVTGGELPLASCRLTRPVPKDRIFDVMAEIRKLSLAAPVQAGTIAAHDVLGLGSDVIVTKTVERLQ